jgi:hypothetical protein
VVFHPLNREQLAEVLQIELSQVQQRVLETANGQFLFRMTDAGREFLLCEGTDQRYAARHLKRAIEHHVVFPLANLLATGQVQVGDMLCIDWDPRVGGLVFWKRQSAAVDSATPTASLNSDTQGRWSRRPRCRSNLFPPRREVLETVNKPSITAY